MSIGLLTVKAYHVKLLWSGQFFKINSKVNLEAASMLNPRPAPGSFV